MTLRGPACAALTLVLIAAAWPASSSASVPHPRPTPTIPIIGGEPSPSPSESEPPEQQEPDEEQQAEQDPPRDQDAVRRDAKQDKPRTRSATLRRARDKKRARNPKIPAWVRNYETKGYYSTLVVDLVARHLRAMGHSAAEALSIYHGLPIAGPSAWTDSWGAPRHEFGRRYRHHQGQDLFCRPGAPILATANGRIEFDVDELGGRVARLDLEPGTYLYFAHLSAWNTRRFSSGDRIERGDVLGFCGSTGNARGTPPHLHLGWYRNGVALNPIRLLERSLRKTEVFATRVLRATKHVRNRLLESSRLPRSGVERCPRMARHPAIDLVLELLSPSLQAPSIRA